MPRSVEGLIRRISVLVAAWLVMVVLVLVGCDSPIPTAPPDAGPLDAGPAVCAAGEHLRDDGTCQPAGLPPDMPCPPGELLRDDDKTCEKAGVPPSACGVGFVSDGKDGCEPILPADPCPEGLMAIPGDTECHEVVSCGSGTWGDIPVDASTQFVDPSYAGGNSDGTQAKPWTTIQNGVDAAVKGAIVAVAAGSYPEDVVILGNAVRLWGRCPAMVEVIGTGAEPGAIQVLQKAASGTEIRGLAITGTKVGIGVSGASDVTIEKVWIHGMGGRGLAVEDDLGLTSVVVKGSLFEQNDEIGVFVAGPEITIEASVIRSTLPNAQGYFGRGINIQPGVSAKERASLTVRKSLLEHNHDSGAIISGADATIEGTVIRSTGPGLDGNGPGIAIQDDAEKKARANVTVRACVVEQNLGGGVFVEGSDATLEATVVRATLLDAQGKEGRGINIQDSLTSNERANVTVRASLVEQNVDAGVIVLGSDATLEATVIRGNLPNAKGKHGRGISIQDTTNARANVIVRGCLVEQNHEIGVFVLGSDATLEATKIRATLVDESGEFGHGLVILDRHATNERANVIVRACLVELNHQLGVSVEGSDATFETTVIRATLPDAQGLDGRGINIQYDLTTKARANVTIWASLVEENRGVGVHVISSDVTLEGTVVRATLPEGQGVFGHGISVQMDPDVKERSNATLRRCIVEQNHGFGVVVFDSDATIVDSTVRNIVPQSSDNKFGDGISATLGTIVLQNVDVTDNARAGVSNFGGDVVITGGVIICNGFDLEGEPYNNTPFSFDGSTGWQCSDKAPAACIELGDCHVATIGIEPPPELPPTDPVPQ